MLNFRLCILWTVLFLVELSGSTRKTKCLNSPRTAKRVEIYIKDCQNEVKNKMIQEAFQILKEEVKIYHDNEEEEELLGDSYIHSDFEYLASDENPHDRITKVRKRKEGHSAIYHPTLMPYENKRIAGCLLNCVYAKNNAIDTMGWPTLDGLVNFYSEGVNEHGFFMATLQAVNRCLKAVGSKHHVKRHKLPEKGESCDVAFDVFDCISDQITGYCLDNYHS